MIKNLKQMKRTYFLITVLLMFVLASAQNLLHYAVSTNGDKGDCLFPEDNSGNVVFSSIIDVPCSADTIMLIADDYISAQNITDRCVVKNLSKSSRTSTYSVQLNIGKQMWGVEYWGSPLFVFSRDASHVKFKCIIEARNGKYKYSLVDFETNRRTIRGDAKNDGQPNIIHWQRVNSLTKERNEYASKNDVNKRKVKEVLFDFNTQIAYETCLYQAEFDATKRFEDGLRNLKWTDDFMDNTNTVSDAENKLNNSLQGRNFSFSLFGDGFFTQSGDTSVKSEKPTSNFSNYNGFLLDKNCNVFVTSDNHPYEDAGAQELIKQIMIDGFWNVVDNINQAHFVLKYYVDLEGRDKAYLVVMTPNGDSQIELAKSRSSESARGNKEVARNMYLYHIMPLCKKIESQKYPKSLSKFITIK